MPSLASDLAFGTKSEISNTELLQDYLETTLERRGGYYVMDYVNPSKTIYVELKTRRIRHDQYDTALIGLNKVMACQNPDIKYYFAYCYLDGLYVIQYDKELFDTFEIQKDYLRGAREGIVDIAQSVVHIPTNLLTKIEPKH